MDENKSPSAAPVPKVLAATSGAGLGSAIGVVLPWVSQTFFGIEMPVEVAIAFGGLFSIIGSFVAGYMTPPRGGS